MKILKVIVDEVPEGCAGKATQPNHHPEPCEFMMVGDGLWCFITNKSVEVDNDPFNGERPDWCPLIRGEFQAALDE